MTWVVATAVLVFLLAVMALAFTATEGLERESRIISDEMESFRLYGQQLQEKNRALRRYRHDANTLVQAIEYALAQEGVRDQARESLAGSGMGDTARTGKMDEGKSESTQRSEAGALGRLGRKRPGGVRGAAAKACSGAWIPQMPPRSDRASPTPSATVWACASSTTSPTPTLARVAPISTPQLAPCTLRFTCAENETPGSWYQVFHFSAKQFLLD